MPQVDFIGVTHPSTIIFGHDGEGGLFEVLAVRSHTFVQGLGHSRQLSVPEEGHMLAVVFRLLDKLRIIQVSEVGFNIFQCPTLKIGFQQSRGDTSIVRVIH